MLWIKLIDIRGQLNVAEMKHEHINMSAHRHLHINTGKRPKAISAGVFCLQADVCSGDQVADFCYVCMMKGWK